MRDLLVVFEYRTHMLKDKKDVAKGLFDVNYHQYINMILISSVFRAFQLGMEVICPMSC